MTWKLSKPSAPPESQTWCAIPVYNNAATIFDVATRARMQLPNVLVIDDGSTDADLRELLKEIGVTVIRHPVNRGKGAALATAFDAAAKGGAKYLITLDGDGQHFPEDIPRFFPELSPEVILIGRRDEITGEMPRSSLFGRDFSDFWIGVETGVVVHDTQSGFRAYPVAPMCGLAIRSRHYNFEVEIITRALWWGLRVGSVPIRVWYPDTASRISSFDPIRDNLRISLAHTKLVARELLPIPHRSPRHTSDTLGLSPSPGTPDFGELSRIGEGRGGKADLRADSEQVSWWRGLCSPLGLAASAGVSALLGIVLWPWGPIAILYITGRLHLNKAAALMVIAVTALPLVPAFSMRVADHVAPASAGPHLRWFVGAHIVAFTIAPALTIIVYTLAKYRLSCSLSRRTGRGRTSPATREPSV